MNDIAEYVTAGLIALFVIAAGVVLIAALWSRAIEEARREEEDKAAIMRAIRRMR